MADHTIDEVYAQVEALATQVQNVQWSLNSAPLALTYTFADASTVTLYKLLLALTAREPYYESIDGTANLMYTGGRWLLTVGATSSTYENTAGISNLGATPTKLMGGGPACSGITIVRPFGITPMLPTKSYLTGTNNLDGDVELNEATGVLSAAALAACMDAVPTTAPTGAPSGWTFRQWMMWLFHRFRKAQKTPTSITVLSGSTTLSTQAITDDNAGTETLGEPE